MYQALNRENGALGLGDEIAEVHRGVQKGVGRSLSLRQKRGLEERDSGRRERVMQQQMKHVITKGNVRERKKSKQEALLEQAVLPEFTQISEHIG